MLAVGVMEAASREDVSVMDASKGFVMEVNISSSSGIAIYFSLDDTLLNFFGIFLFV